MNASRAGLALSTGHREDLTDLELHTRQLVRRGLSWDWEAVALTELNPPSRGPGGGVLCGSPYCAFHDGQWKHFGVGAA